MPKEWIFFDCFNTLIDDFDPAGSESGLGSLPRLAVEISAFESERAFVTAFERFSHGAGPGREVTLSDRLFRAVSPVVQRSDLAWSIVNKLMARWYDEYPSTLRLTPGAKEMLEYWEDKSRLGVVSNFFVPDLPRQFLSALGLDSHFEFILDSAAFGFKKPGREIFQRAMELSRLLPHQANDVLFVGDRLDLDIYPARSFGMETLHFNRGRTRPGIAPSPADVVCIHDWSEFR